jgi:hypothetical protein
MNASMVTLLRHSTVLVAISTTVCSVSKTASEAVCVICQYQMENGFELFDILIDDMDYDIRI